LPLVAQPASSSIEFSNVTVIDGSGRPAQSGMSVVVAGDRIIGLGKTGGVAVPEGARVVDASGKFMIPGLWDMHVHYRPHAWPLFVASGVTGVRVMLGNPQRKALRDRVLSGEAQLPHILLASPGFSDVPPWVRSGDAEWSQISTPEEARRAVRMAKEQGYDFIKVSTFIKREHYDAIADEAARVSIPFEGHLPYSMGPGYASDSGQRTIEHLWQVAMDCSSEAQALQDRREREQQPFRYDLDKYSQIEAEAWETYDEIVAAEFYEKLKVNNTWICPTLTLQHLRGNAVDTSFPDDPRLRRVPAWEANRWDRDRENSFLPRVENEKKKLEIYFGLLGKMHEAGVGILAGTDMGNPYCHSELGVQDELELLVRAGLSPMEALQTATRNPAEYQGRLDELGTIEVGKLADLVLLEKNPLEDIRHTRMISGVVMHGRWLPQETLGRMVADAEQTARLERLGGGWERDLSKPYLPVVEARLTSRRFGDEQVGWLDGFSGLEAVDLSFSRVSDRGLQDVAKHTRLKSLTLSNTEVTDEGLKPLVALAALQNLSLSDTSIGDEGIGHIRSLTQLTRLWLHKTKVSDAGLRHLQHMARLNTLTLGGTEVGDAGLQHLAGLTSLESLVLNVGRVTDDGLKNLKRLRNLRVLHLNHTRVTDAGLVHLEGLTKLKTLSLEGTRITEAGISHLKEALPGLVVRHSPYGRFEVAVAHTSHDAEERVDGEVVVRSYDLELVNDLGPQNTQPVGQVVGFWFGDIGIPVGAHLKKAYVQFTSQSAGAEPTRLMIHAEMSLKPAVFQFPRGNISGRPKSEVFVEWAPPPWGERGERGEAQRTPDIAPLIKAVMAQDGWQRGNALALIIRGSGRRVAEAFDSKPAAAPTLVIEYE
jgi:hypothetical protein